jgi:hypothetical protein
MRANHARELLESATEIVSQSGAHEMETWRSAWQRRLDTAQRQIRQKQSAASGTEDARSDSGTSSTIDDVRSYDAASIWRRQQEPLNSTVQGMLLGSSDSFQLDYASTRLHDLGRRGLMATALFGLVALFVLGRRNRTLNEWGLRWPYVVGVLLGMVWWLFCTPSLLGLAVILAAVIGAFSPAWVTR